MIAAPMLPGRREAPTTATERGRRTCSTAATAAIRSRSSKRRRPSSVSVVGKVTSSSPGRDAHLDREAGRAERLDHLAVAGSTTAVNGSIPSAAPICASWASRSVAMPRPCQSSATANATSRRRCRPARTGRGRRPSPSPGSPRPGRPRAGRRTAAPRADVGAALKKRNVRASSERRPGSGDPSTSSDAHRPDVHGGAIAERDVGFGGDDRHESKLAPPVRQRTRTWPTRGGENHGCPAPRRRHTLVSWTVPDRP